MFSTYLQPVHVYIQRFTSLDLSLWEINKLYPIHSYMVFLLLTLTLAVPQSHVITKVTYSFWGITIICISFSNTEMNNFHLSPIETSSQNVKVIYKSDVITEEAYLGIAKTKMLYGIHQTLFSKYNDKKKQSGYTRLIYYI